jgi:hypothetical protein
MEALVVSEVERVLQDFELGANLLDGVLYMMFWVRSEKVVPLYVGRAGKYARDRIGLSANLAKIRSNTNFARFGYSYAYHLGDLSAAACPDHSPPNIKPKYRRWAERLFETSPARRPRLREEVRFWMAAWGPASPSIWPEYGAASLAFEEYLLIGVASDLFLDTLLNDEAVHHLSANERSESEAAV